MPASVAARPDWSKTIGYLLSRAPVDDVLLGGRVRQRAMVVQRKTGRPVQFELTEQTRDAPLTAGKPKVAYSQLAAAFRLTGAAFTSRYRQRLVSYRPK